MDIFLDRLDTRFSEFVSRISHFESIAEFPAEFESLDRELVAQVAELRQHYEACKKIEALKLEGAALDQKVNSILIELAQFREELESSPTAPLPSANVAVNTQELLDYSSKITRFTRQLPGSAEVGILPWPAEDQLRRGMLATLTIQEESAPFDDGSAGAVEAGPSAPEESQAPVQTAAKAAAAPAEPKAAASREAPPPPRAKPAPKPKISLDLSSDED